ncbi:unnamed protein product [Durusdinium trenchii]|uniref:Uncharacterized protein n=1 Tax=Durusdinium trenchii TaxID=1381693 RepID=A0ABP0LB39_9DINO
MGQDCSSCTARGEEVSKACLPGAPPEEHEIGGSNVLSNTYFDQDLKELQSLPAGDRQVVEERPLYRFRSGNSYAGEWLGNERHGLGVQRWLDGAVYHGSWRHNCAHGLGRFVHTDGDTYSGEWQKNVAHGVGNYVHYAKGQVTRYFGQWHQDLQHGYGIERWDEGSCFEGEFRVAWAETTGHRMRGRLSGIHSLQEPWKWMEVEFTSFFGMRISWSAETSGAMPSTFAHDHSVSLKADCVSHECNECRWTRTGCASCFVHDHLPIFPPSVGTPQRSWCKVADRFMRW